MILNSPPPLSTWRMIGVADPALALSIKMVSAGADKSGTARRCVNLRCQMNKLFTMGHECLVFWNLSILCFAPVETWSIPTSILYVMRRLISSTLLQSCWVASGAWHLDCTLVNCWPLVITCWAILLLWAWCLLPGRCSHQWKKSIVQDKDQLTTYACRIDQAVVMN